MTQKATIVRLPGATLVSVEPTSKVTKGGRTLDRVVYLDTNNNGLDAGDVMFSFYYVTKPSGAKGIIFGNTDPYPRTEIHQRSLTARDVRKLSRTFKKRFVKLVRAAGTHRSDVKKMPKVTQAVCHAYWKIIGRKAKGMEAIAPVGKKVRFSTPVTLSTRVNMQALGKRSPRIPYHVRKPRPVNPALCRAISATKTMSIGGTNKKVKITAGAPSYPIWLSLLFGTTLFKSKYQNYLARVGVDYTIGKDRFIHLALVSATLVAWRR